MSHMEVTFLQPNKFEKSAVALVGSREMNESGLVNWLRAYLYTLFSAGTIRGGA